MNKLEVKYVQIVSEEYNDSFDEGGHTLLDTQKIAKQSTEITTDVAIKFAEWLESNDCKDVIHDFKIVGEDYSKKSLFNEFINNHYGK
jgi:ABC-type tungstate transport system permease subunit